MKDKIAKGKIPNKNGKSLKDQLSGTWKDQCLKAVRNLTNVINGQNKTIKKQSVKLQELEAKLSEKSQFEQKKTNELETKLDKVKALIIGVQDKLNSFSQNARINPKVDRITEIWP